MATIHYYTKPKLAAFVIMFAAATMLTNCSKTQGKFKVPDKVNAKATPFSLKDVRLLDSPFKKAMELDGAWLLKLDPDRLLYRFYKNAGLETKGEIYGGWESMGISGHTLGHYLSACSMMYASTGDERFKEKVAYTVGQLAKCQEARGTGYVGGIPDEEKLWNDVAAGKISSKGFDLNGAWVPWYTLHKLWAGLIDSYLWCDNEQAKTVVVKLSDWAVDELKNLNDAQFQKMLACEHGGMNEVLANVYAMTGEKKYLDLSRRFYQKAVLDPLSQRKDDLNGLHANTQIPKIIGCARLYELTGEKKDLTIASFFWDAVVHHHTYANGGNSNYEHFGPADSLATRLGTNTSETCNTYNMLKLTRHLFALDPEVKYADYYEKALYNHILASQNPETGMVCYYVPLASGDEKTYSTPFDSFWCCVGTGFENHAKYGGSIYFKGADGSLYVNLFIPSVLNWKEKNLTLTTETDYPASGNVKFLIDTSKPESIPLKVRVPSWLKAAPVIKVNGEEINQPAKPGTYATIERKWQKGDVVTMDLPLDLRAEPMPDDRQKEAIYYGPALLSASLKYLENDKNFEYKIPVLLAENEPIGQVVEEKSQHPLVFETNATGRGNEISLIPFYKMHHQKYMVYFDVLGKDDWKEKRKVEDEKIKERLALEARTVDEMRIGEMQPERDHDFKGEKTNTGGMNGKKWRDASDGGWFSFDLKVQHGVPLELMCTYWGSDSGNRVFDVLVDGQKIATQTLDNNHPGKFFDEHYPVPPEVLKGKDKITVRFQAHPGKMAGGLFGCMLLKRKS